MGRLSLSGHCVVPLGLSPPDAIKKLGRDSVLVKLAHQGEMCGDGVFMSDSLMTNEHFLLRGPRTFRALELFKT